MADDATALKTDRLELRMLRLDDAVAITALIQNWNVLRMLSSPPHPYGLADAEGFIAHRLEIGNTPQDCVYAISIEDELVGVIGIEPNADGEPTLGYWLGETYWDKGLMSDAAALLVHHYFAVSERDTLYCAAFCENPASIRIQQKVGFTRMGDTEIFSKPRNAMMKCIATRLTRDEYRRQRRQ